MPPSLKKSLERINKKNEDKDNSPSKNKSNKQQQSAMRGKYKFKQIDEITEESAEDISHSISDPLTSSESY